jgi:transposase-like protein
MAIRDLKMKPSDFADWLAALSSLSAAQRRVAFRELALAEADDPGEEGVEIGEPGSGPGTDPKRSKERGEAVSATPSTSGGRDIFRDIARERLAATGCPRCGAPDVRPWGKARGLPRYRCVECRRTFNPFTGTPVAGLHNKDRWPDQARALIEGESLAKAAERCRIHPSTAFRWRHRFLAAHNLDKPKSLSGVVEADETFILESFKGRRGGLARPARRRGGKAAKRGLSAEQIPIVVARDRSGATFDALLPRLDAESLKEAFGDRIAPSTDFCCDGGSAIAAFARRAKLKVHVLPAPGNPKPEEPEFHINNVNAYHGRLKAWMQRFHGVATENLPTYLSWRRTLEAMPENGDPDLWIAAAAGLGPYQHGIR